MWVSKTDARKMSSIMSQFQRVLKLRKSFSLPVPFTLLYLLMFSELIP
jgi:hypothetical protein